MRNTLSDGFFGLFKNLFAEGFSTVGLELASSQPGFFDSFGNFIGIEINDFPITFLDFFEHKNY